MKDQDSEARVDGECDVPPAGSTAQIATSGAPTLGDYLAEIRRVRARCERLERVIATGRPEVEALRDIATRVRALLPGNDDLPSLTELGGMWSEGADRVEAALQATERTTAEISALDPVARAPHAPSTRDEKSSISVAEGASPAPHQKPPLTIADRLAARHLPTDSDLRDLVDEAVEVLREQDERLRLVASPAPPAETQENEDAESAGTGIHRGRVIPDGTPSPYDAGAFRVGGPRAPAFVSESTYGLTETAAVLLWLDQAVIDYDTENYRPSAHYRSLFVGAAAEIRRLAEAASTLPLDPEPLSQTLKRDIEQALEYLKDYDASRRAHGYRAHQSVDKCRSVMEMALGRVAASPLPRPKELKHPTRTIIVATRLSEKTLRTTYLNAIDDDEPYIVTIDLNEPPHTPVSGVVPDVGETKVVVNR